MPDIMAARAEALRLAGELIRDEARHAEFGEDWCLVVRNDNDLRLFRMEFILTESPAVPKGGKRT